MRIVVVYESMFGNTRQVAEAIAGELAADHDVEVTTAGAATAAAPGAGDDPDLVVVGAPTHVHALPSTRRAVPDYVARADGALHTEPSAGGPGVREWLAAQGPGRWSVATFDTRLEKPAFLVGHPARSVARSVRCHGHTVAGVESFFVDASNRMLPGELDRAREWARRVASSTVARVPSTRPPQ